MNLVNNLVTIGENICKLEHASNGAEPKCVRQGVHGWKRDHCWKRFHCQKIVNGTMEKVQVELAPHSACVTREGAEVHGHGVHGQKRNYSRERVHGTIEKEQAELTTHSACITWGRAEVHVSWRLWSEKSSWYNRKGESSASNM